MKEGWKIVKLGKCFSSINNGANIKQIKGAQGFPITRIETLSNDKFNRDRMGYADIYDYSKYSNYILNDGDILMSHINSMKFLGRSVLYNKINNETIIHGMNLLRLVPITNLILCSYVNYYFSTKSFKEQIQGISHQSVNQASFNVTSLKNLDVILPPLEEQHRIVSILDASFEKIDVLKKNAEKNLKNAKALFQQVLAQELKPKEGWVEKKLGEICSKIGSGATPHGGKESYKEEGVSLIRSLNVYDNEFIYDDLAHIDDKQADELNNVIIEKNDVLFNITGASVTRCCIVPNKILPARVNQHVSILRPKNGVLTNVFLCYLMISMKDYLIKLAFSKGATRQAITKKQLEDLMIAYPNDIDEQMSIVNTINTLSEKCRRLEQVAQQTIRECDALKQSILRQAFSGEL